MPFRGRKSIPVIPGLLKYNFAVSAGKDRGVNTSGSWTMGILGFATYNTRDGRYRVNTPGWGWWESRTRAQREKRKLDKKVAKVRGSQPAKGGRARGQTGDPQAAMYAKYFRDLRREGVDPTTAARAAGRCPNCGHRMRPGQWCVPCAERAAKKHEQAEARAAARGRAETRLYGEEPGPPPTVRPRGGTTSGGFSIAPDPAIPGSESYVWAGRPGYSNVLGGPFQDNATAAAWVRENAVDVVRASGDQPPETGNGYGKEQLRASGLCGARTQRDGTPCLNHAGSCPHHRAGVLR